MTRLRALSTSARSDDEMEMAGKKSDPSNRKAMESKGDETRPHRSRQATPRKTATETESLFTRREEQVLRRLAWGYAIKTIARDLGISVKTVEFHRTAAMKKAELGDRVDLLRLAVARGWMRREPS